MTLTGWPLKVIHLHLTCGHSLRGLTRLGPFAQVARSGRGSPGLLNYERM